jgi:MFS family permease
VLRPYRELAAVPRVPGLLAWSMLGRLHLTGTPLAMSFLIAGWTGSYTVAGVVGAALMAGLGVAGPLRGRAADRRGAAGLLMVTGVIYGVGLTVLAFLPGWLPAGWWPVVALAAFVVGLGNPPVAPVSRAAWPRLIEGPALNSIYTVEATLVELLYVIGPMLAATVVALLSPAVAIVVIAVLATLGALGFARSLRLAGMAGPVPSSPGRARVGLLTAPGIVAALGLSLAGRATAACRYWPECSAGCGRSGRRSAGSWPVA